jgi:hypothetical protein
VALGASQVTVAAHDTQSVQATAGVSWKLIYNKLRGGNYAIYPAELRRAFPSAAQASAGVTEQGAPTFLFPAWDVS